MFKKETTVVAHSFLPYKHKLKVFDLFLRRRKQHSDRKLFFFYVKKFHMESTQITFHPNPIFFCTTARNCCAHDTYRADCYRSLTMRLKSGLRFMSEVWVLKYLRFGALWLCEYEIILPDWLPFKAWFSSSPSARCLNSLSLGVKSCDVLPSASTL